MQDSAATVAVSRSSWDYIQSLSDNIGWCSPNFGSWRCSFLSHVTRSQPRNNSSSRNVMSSYASCGWSDVLCLRFTYVRHSHCAPQTFGKIPHPCWLVLFWACLLSSHGIRAMVNTYASWSILSNRACRPNPSEMYPGSFKGIVVIPCKLWCYIIEFCHTETTLN